MSQPAESSIVIWQFGDPWRHLRDEIISACTTTIVTAHLTIHLIDLAKCRTTRLPSGLGTFLAEDGTPRTLISIKVATPCGIVTLFDPIESSQWSTPIALVVRGIQLDWSETHLSRLREAAAELDPGPALDHPATHCGSALLQGPQRPYKAD